MKKRTFKPGFEFIFSLSLMAILGLPPLVSAQDKKQTDLQITINNSDTTINGKNIKNLSADERKDALKSINQIATINNGDANGKREMVIVTRKKRDGNGGNEIIVDKRGMGDNQQEPLMADNDVIAGTHARRYRFKVKIDNDSTYAFNTFHTDNTPDRKVESHFNRDDERGDRPMGFNRKNTQNFMYNNTDNNGISTRVSYHVSDHPATLDYDAGKKELKQLEMLDITDLNIVPEFSAGKTVMMFSLPSKTAAEVQLKDSKGNLLWSDKAINGTFNKSFALGLNGLYYLQVKQGNKIAVKEIMKD